MDYIKEGEENKTEREKSKLLTSGYFYLLFLLSKYRELHYYVDSGRLNLLFSKILIYFEYYPDP